MYPSEYTNNPGKQALWAVLSVYRDKVYNGLTLSATLLAYPSAETALMLLLDDTEDAISAFVREFRIPGIRPVIHLVVHDDEILHWSYTIEESSTHRRATIDDIGQEMTLYGRHCQTGIREGKVWMGIPGSSETLLTVKEFQAEAEAGRIIVRK